MEKVNESVANQWAKRLDRWEDSVRLRYPESAYAYYITNLDKAMRRFIRTRGDAYSLYQDRLGRTHVRKSAEAEALRTCLRYPLQDIGQFFNRHKFSPYFRLFSHRATSVGADAVAKPQTNEDWVSANSWFATLRDEATNLAYADEVARYERSARKNLKSAKGYVRQLHERCSRLLVVRIDLGYSKLHRVGLKDSDVSIRRAKLDLAMFLKGLRRNYPQLLGYIWKLEYGPSKSYHFHVMIIFNGHLLRNDTGIGLNLGRHWVEEVTFGDGSYWNCNAEKEAYAEAGCLGIGSIPYDDRPLRENLEKAVAYLAKVDYYVRLNTDAGKTFGKGLATSGRATRSGRPRHRLEGRR